MDSFIYNSHVSGRNFLGRKSETSILGNLLSQGEDVVMYEYPKAGVTSLIQMTLYNMKIEGLNFDTVQLSLLNIRSREEFLCRLGGEVLKKFAATPHELTDLVGRYLGGSHFIFDPLVYSSTGKVLATDWELDDDDILAILSLPRRMATESGKRIIILLDHFQSIMLCEKGELICKIWEDEMKNADAASRKAFSWIFCGSRLNAMKDIFENKRYFYRQVTRVKLKPVESHDIIEHTVKEFLVTGKVVEREQLQEICELFRNNVWYINHFCSICDSLSKGFINDYTIRDSIKCLTAIHEPRFIGIISDCTTFQIQMLRAIMEGNRKFNSAEVIRKYSLSSASNVKRLKEALCKKEIITFDENDEPEIIDPLFEQWLAKYFEIKK